MATGKVGVRGPTLKADRRQAAAIEAYVGIPTEALEKIAAQLVTDRPAALAAAAARALAEAVARWREIPEVRFDRIIDAASRFNDPPRHFLEAR